MGSRAKLLFLMILNSPSSTSVGAASTALQIPEIIIFTAHQAWSYIYVPDVQSSLPPGRWKNTYPWCFLSPEHNAVGRYGNLGYVIIFLHSQYGGNITHGLKLTGYFLNLLFTYCFNAGVTVNFWL
jgi:hypothetical protein